MSAKIPKTQAAAITLATEMLANFGFAVFRPNPYFKKLADLAGHSNVAIRNAALGFYAESYRWMRDVLKPLLDHLKPAQMAELEKKFEEVAKEPPARPKRYPASKRVE